MPTFKNKSLPLTSSQFLIFRSSVFLYLRLFSYRKIHKKTPAPEPLCENFRNTFFTEHLGMAAFWKVRPSVTWVLFLAPQNLTNHSYSHYIKLLLSKSGTFLHIYFSRVSCISQEKHLQNLAFQPSVVYESVTYM